mmetsp:Transcript_54389/g.122202  ORF Transcript_54389/g.122202 Transcript_54389/m.122202 type:complete len:175 (-) Transcript_54389:13-537(-)
MARAPVPIDAQRQLERAQRLIGTAQQGVGTPVHKSLEQLFGEARLRAQMAPYSASSSSLILQTPQAQQLDRDVAAFALGPATGVRPGELGGDGGLADYFAFRHEKVLLGTVEAALRDNVRRSERHTFNRIQADWEETKRQLLWQVRDQQVPPQRLGLGPTATFAMDLPSPLARW